MKFYLSLLCFIYSTISLSAETISSSDYSHVLQDAIDALEESTDSERVLIIERGTYLQAITISDNITIKGEETAQSVLTYPSDNTAIITITGDTFVNILNLTFSSANLGIQLNSGAQGNINNNRYYKKYSK